MRNSEATLNLDNLGTFWKQTLLDIFLTTWVPDIRWKRITGSNRPFNLHLWHCGLG